MTDAEYKAAQEAAQYADRANPARAQNAAAIGGKELAQLQDIKRLAMEERELVLTAKKWLVKMGWRLGDMELAYEENTTILLCPKGNNFAPRQAVFQTVLTLTHQYDEGALLVAADAELEGKLGARDEILANDRTSANVVGKWKVDKENYRPPPGYWPAGGDEPDEG